MNSGLIRSMVGCLIAAFAVLGCKPAPPTLKTYEKDGAKFAHFSDWKVAEDQSIENTPGTRSIVVEGPDNAIVSFTFIPAAPGQTLEVFANEVAEARRAEVKKALSIGPMTAGSAGATRSQPTHGRIGGRPQTGILQHFKVTVLGHDVPHEARFFMLDLPPSTVFVTTQVSSEDAAALEKGFETLLDSFVAAPAR